MVIQIRLGNRIDHTPEQIATDSLDRAWSGYAPTVSEEALWEHNRGRWTLSEARIADEKYASFVHGGRVVAVYGIDDHERVADPGPHGSKIALIGRPLPATDSIRQALIGQEVDHAGRNAINYVDDPTVSAPTAATSGRAFLLTWNPTHWDWPGFSEAVGETQRGNTVIDRWSTGGRTSGIYPGDRLFLLRQGNQGRGIVGSGRAVGPYDHAEIIYPAEHWDGSGSMANYVDVEWDRMLPIERRLTLA